MVVTGGTDASRYPAASAYDRVPTASSPSPTLLAQMALTDGRRIRDVFFPIWGSAPSSPGDELPHDPVGRGNQGSVALLRSDADVAVAFGDGGEVSSRVGTT